MAGPVIRVAGIDHIVLRVSESAAVGRGRDLERLARHGIEAQIVTRYGAEGDRPSIYLSDPEGNMIELKGPPSAPF